MALFSVKCLFRDDCCNNSTCLLIFVACPYRAVCACWLLKIHQVPKQNRSHAVTWHGARVRTDVVFVKHYRVFERKCLHYRVSQLLDFFICDCLAAFCVFITRVFCTVGVFRCEARENPTFLRR